LALRLKEKIDRRRDAEKQKYTDLRMKKLGTGRWHLRFGTHDFWKREKESEDDSGVPRVSILIKGILIAIQLVHFLIYFNIQPFCSADVDGSLDAISECLKTYNDPVSLPTILPVVECKCFSVVCKGYLHKLGSPWSSGQRHLAEN